MASLLSPFANRFSTRLGFRKVCLFNSASLITEIKNVNFCLLISTETNNFLVINLTQPIWSNPRGKNIIIIDIW